MKRAPQAFGAHTACVDGAHLRGVTRASGSKGSGFKLGGRCEHAASTLFNKSGQLPIPPSPPLSHRAVPVCVAAAFFAAGQPLQLIAWVERVRLTPRALQWGGVANQFGRQCAVWARGILFAATSPQPLQILTLATHGCHVTSCAAVKVELNAGIAQRQAPDGIEKGDGGAALRAAPVVGVAAAWDGRRGGQQRAGGRVWQSRRVGRLKRLCTHAQNDGGSSAGLKHAEHC